MAERKPKPKPKSPPKSKTGFRAGADKAGKAATKPEAPPARRGGRLVVRALKWSVVAGIWVALALGVLVAWYAYDLPDIDNLDVPTRKAGITLLDADGRTFASYGELYGDPVRVADVPPHLVQAIVATEDRRFFEHSGFDPWALLRATAANIRAGRVRQGGSTLTQQLAKNIFLQPDRTLRRKVQELLLAFWLEANFTKEQIFALYLNRVYLGSGTYGVDAAARRYFGKPARRLSLLESAVIAGLLKAPTRYSPLRDAEAATTRAHVVLGAMVDAGFLDAETAKRTRAQKLRVAGNRGGSPSSRYFADWALEQVNGFVGRQGVDLVVRTTFDTRLQTDAAKRVSAALAAGAARKVTQGAFVAMSPDGAVRALVGGGDYGDSQFNRATQALRQPGSAFKLFVYLAAMENGLDPDSRFVDGPVKVGNWSPRNYDGDYLGTVTLREAVARSVNTVAVQVSERVGRQKVIDAARRLGITSPLKSHPSLALGASEVSLMELTAAYGVIANGGVAVWPHAIVEIADRRGNVLYRRTDGAAPQVVEPQTVRAVNDLLRSVVAWGTGKAADPGRPAAGKTGTSQDSRDAWFVGYTGDLVAGVWLGNDDSSPMKSVTGGSLPARLWGQVMRSASAGRPVRPLAPVRVTAPPPAVSSAATKSSGGGIGGGLEDYNRGD
jgi:penicillin-binding protein 1A